METESYTRPSSASSGNDKADLPSMDFTLPEGEKFRSLPPQISLSEFIRRNRQLRAWFPKGIRTASERWEAKTMVEFRL